MSSTTAGSARLTAPRIAAASSWDRRLYDGLRVARVSPDVRAGLGAALGQMGVEAEYLLLLVSSFPGEARPSRALGETFLARLATALERIVDASANLEAATQGFVSELRDAYPGMRWQPGRVAAWWPVFTGYTAPGAPLEARLRRSGFSYRHVLASNLPAHLDATLEQMALFLYALSTLPPAGVAPLAALAEGLDELSSAMQGEIVPRHIRGLSGDEQFPGALAAIARLAALDVAGDTSLESDINWARAQYVAARNEENQLAKQTGHDQTKALAAHDAYEWATVVGLLEGMRRYEAPRR
ncbi:MAG TPA: hypothetical protein VF808_19940 [Ktedonobacterales bacterium]